MQAAKLNGRNVVVCWGLFLDQPAPELRYLTQVAKLQEKQQQAARCSGDTIQEDEVDENLVKCKDFFS